MVRRKRVLFAASLAGVSLLFAGCGDDLGAMVAVSGTIVMQGSAESQESGAGQVQESSVSESAENGQQESGTGESAGNGQQESGTGESAGNGQQESSTGESAGNGQQESGTGESAENGQQSEHTQEKADPASGENTEDKVEEAPEEITITITAAGDCSLGNHHEQSYASTFNQAYDQARDPGYFFENVKDIFEADDMTIVNLEGVLTESEERQPDRTFNIKGKPEYAAILTAGSVEAVSMGNNHRLDYGVSGTADTVAALESEEIVYAYDDIVGVYEVKGIKIGFVSVNEVSWGLGSEKLIKNGIAALQEQEADLIIACCHWGIEKDHYTEDYQNELGRICIDAGADLVLGHHPHVLQGIEEYNGRYIVYSLANFSFGANRNPKDKDTMIFQQTFSFIEGEKQEPGQAKVIPCSVSSVAERNNYQPTPLTGEEAERVIGRINTYSEEYGIVIDEDGVIGRKESDVNNSINGKG